MKKTNFFKKILKKIKNFFKKSKKNKKISINLVKLKKIDNIFKFSLSFRDGITYYGDIDCVINKQIKLHHNNISKVTPCLYILGIDLTTNAFEDRKIIHDILSELISECNKQKITLLTYTQNIETYDDTDYGYDYDGDIRYVENENDEYLNSLVDYLDYVMSLYFIPLDPDCQHVLVNEETINNAFMVNNA